MLNPTSSPTPLVLDNAEIYGSILIVIASLSVLSSMMTLYLIWVMKKWNGYLLLISSMTVCQMLYDSSYFFLAGYSNISLYSVMIFLTTFGGLSVTFWINIFSYIVYSTVMNLRGVNIMNNYAMYCVVCTIPAVVYAALSVFCDDSTYCPETVNLDLGYNIIRISSIAFNALLYILVSRKLRSMGRGNGESEDALGALVSRLKYYPLVQIFTRVFASYYELKYGVEFVNWSHAPPQQQLSLILFALFCPAAGIGFFITFLIMQPLAYANFKSIICCGQIVTELDSNASAVVSTTEDKVISQCTVSNEVLSTEKFSEQYRNTVVGYNNPNNNNNNGMTGGNRLSMFLWDEEDLVREINGMGRQSSNDNNNSQFVAIRATVTSNGRSSSGMGKMSTVKNETNNLRTSLLENDEENGECTYHKKPFEDL